MNFQQPPQYHITPSSGYTSLDFDGDKLEITPLGSGNEVGRSAILVQFKGKTVMVCQIAQSFFFNHSTTSIIMQTDTAILFFRVGFQLCSPQLFCCVLLGGVKLFFVLVSAFVRWVNLTVDDWSLLIGTLSRYFFPLVCTPRRHNNIL